MQKTMTLISQRRSIFDHISRSYLVDQDPQTAINIGDYKLAFSSANGFTRYSLSKKQSRENGSVSQAEHVELKGGLFDADYTGLEVRATLLGRPLIVALREPLSVAPKSRSHLTLSRPIAFQAVEKRTQAEITLFSHSALDLRLTTYGEMTKPMICYHWVSDVSGPISESQLACASSGNEAIVPLIIENLTKAPVLLRKLVLYRGLLKLYRTEQQFVTNAVKIMIHSPNEASIKYEEEPLDIGSRCTLIFEPPEEKVPKLLRRLRLKSSRKTGVDYGF